MNKASDTIIMNNGKAMPVIGFGTWKISDSLAEQMIKYALGTGYRHIDTAAAYGNEIGVGKGIKSSGVKRDDIFLTTKHWVSERGYEKTLAAIDNSLKKLGTDYLDLYLIHWPCVEKITPDWAEINADTWRGFEEAHKQGKILTLGVSNFKPHHLEALNKNAKIKPAVNQIEFHPGFTQCDTVEYCQKNGILVQAWSPLGRGRVFENELIVSLAEKYNVSPAKICLRYALQRGVVPLPKSATYDRIVDNIDVFGFEITASDMAAIDSLPITGYSGYDPDDAPVED